MFGLKLENHYAGLPGEFYTLMPAEKVGVQPQLLHVNPNAAALIGLDPAAFADPAFTQVFSGHTPLDGFSPLAMVYSGHQFGVWAGQLGDGRALLIGQARNTRGDLWDIQLKGAGRTPYSRFADGRAVMRSTIREYLCSEVMAALGIPTSRALSIIATNEQVYREAPEPGAVLTRLAPSHIRFGHFEHFFHTGRHEQVRALADHVIAEYFPGLDYSAWFHEVVKRTAEMVAGWQSVGFAHGVMNTDNMSILGLTLDYGPFGFMEAYDPGFICNHTDEQGRYAFDMQPSIAHWNLRALAFALSSLIEKDTLISALDTYEAIYRSRTRILMPAKLGVTQPKPGDDQLIADLLTLMAKARADYTLSFRNLTGEDAAWLALFPQDVIEARGWLARYRARTQGEDLSGMDRVNPRYVLRNWVAETAIRAVEDRGDTDTLARIFKLMQSPFDAHDGGDAFAAPPPPEMCGLEVSCSS
jgi:uncharacterized protein YdiU (UPF0061 family)